MNRNKIKGNKTRKYGIDYGLIFCVFVLIGIGLVMVYSTSYYEASLSESMNYDGAFFLKKQITSVVIGMLLMTITSIIPYRLYSHKIIVFLIYVATVVFIFLVLSPIGVEANGAKRWIRIAGISVQPAEIAKIATIIYCSAIVKIKKYRENLNSFIGYILMMFPVLIIGVMILTITSNLSSAVIIVGIAFVMFFIVAKDIKIPVAIILGGLVAVSGLVTAAYFNILPGYRGDRIRAWLNPEGYIDSIGFQTLQALYAIGTGKIRGKGLGQSTQKMGFIPEAQNDMIFSVICEELGFFGAACIMTLFLILLWRLVVIAGNTNDIFGAMLVVGVMSQIAIQVIFNIAVVTNVIPNTGISLPFISYGGTSVSLLMMEIGIALNVSKALEVYE